MWIFAHLQRIGFVCLVRFFPYMLHENVLMANIMSIRLVKVCYNTFFPIHLRCSFFCSVPFYDAVNMELKLY